MQLRLLVHLHLLIPDPSQNGWPWSCNDQEGGSRRIATIFLDKDIVIMAT
jgi:hypothetical protein